MADATGPEAGLTREGMLLDWEVTPPVGERDPDAAKWFQHDFAEVRYRVEPPLTWDLRTASGGTVDAAPGQPSSHGTYGPYPLSAEALQVSFAVLPYLDRRPRDRNDGKGTGYVIEGSQHPLGQVVIDLRSRTATWEPAAPLPRE